MGEERTGKGDDDDDMSMSYARYYSKLKPRALHGSVGVFRKTEVARGRHCIVLASGNTSVPM